MGILYLVRHAQASFLEQDYDKLSKLGKTQARLLGEYWARRGVVCGLHSALLILTGISRIPHC